MPLVRSKRPSHVRQASERLVRPGGFACHCEDHEPLRRLHSDPRNDESFAIASKQRDRLVELGSAEERFLLVQASDTRAVISLSRTARSPEVVDLIRYENSPVWSAGIKRVTS